MPIAGPQAVYLKSKLMPLDFENYSYSKSEFTFFNINYPVMNNN